MTKKFYPELESARGIAALIVAVFHASQARVFINDVPTHLISRAIEPESFWRYVQMLYKPLTGAALVSPIHPAVLFFFVLSGFVLAGSLESNSSPARFFVARIFRIYPAASASVIAFCVLFFATGLAISPREYSPYSIVANLLLIKTSINGVLWAIQNELVAAPFILIAFLLQRRFGLLALAIVTAALMAAAPWDPARVLVTSIGGSPRIGWIWAFLLGMCAYFAGRRVHLPRITSWVSACAISALLIILLSAFYMTPINSPAKQIIEGVSAALIIFLLAFGPNTGAHNFLNLRIFRFYGKISYSLYVLHAITLTFLFTSPVILTPLLDYMPRTALAIVLGIVSCAFITPFAYLSYRYIELPGIDLGRAILRRVHRATPKPTRPKIVIRRKASTSTADPAPSAEH